MLRGLEKSWRGPSGPIRAVRGIDVSIERGETVALLGPNGAGKSTTIDMILGLAQPDGGTVSVLGRRPGEAVAAGLIGAMLQTGDADPQPLGARADRDDRLALPAADGRRRGARAGRAARASPRSARRSSPAARSSARASPSRWSAIPSC